MTSILSHPSHIIQRDVQRVRRPYKLREAMLLHCRDISACCQCWNDHCLICPSFVLMAEPMHRCLFCPSPVSIVRISVGCLTKKRCLWPRGSLHYCWLVMFFILINGLLHGFFLSGQDSRMEPKTSIYRGFAYHDQIILRKTCYSYLPLYAWTSNCFCGSAICTLIARK